MSVAKAIQIADTRVDAALLPPQPADYTMGDALRSLAGAETSLQRSLRRLARLETQQLARKSDYDGFNIASASLWQAELTYYVFLTRVMEDMPDMFSEPVMSRISQPTLLTVLQGQASAAAAQLDQAQVGLNALPAIGALGWAIVVLAALAGMAIVGWAIAEFSDDIAKVFIVQRQVDAYEEMLDRRQAAMDACIARGGTHGQCLAEVQTLVPLPPDLAAGSIGAGGNKKLFFALGAVVVVAGAGLLYWGWDGIKEKFTPKRGVNGFGGGPLPRRVSGINSSEPSRYFLEVE